MKTLIAGILILSFVAQGPTPQAASAAAATSPAPKPARLEQPLTLYVSTAIYETAAGDYAVYSFVDGARSPAETDANLKKDLAAREPGHKLLSVQVGHVLPELVAKVYRSQQAAPPGVRK